MTTLVWDQVTEKIFQTGVDRGVLYLHDGTVAVWNGLTSVEENCDAELNSFYMDGVKYLQKITPGDFSGKLKAYTYPDEFDQVNGVVSVSPGLSYYDQPSHSFNLSYRTVVGNDLEGVDYAYKIHLLYNLMAVPDSFSYETLADPIKLSEFGWALSGTPSKLEGYRPTVHIDIDSRFTPPDVLQVLEDILYGSESNDPRFPTIKEVENIFKGLGALIIIDNGDGTWTAIDLSDDYITMLDSTTFQIEDADAVYLDAVTYEISSTNVPE